MDRKRERERHTHTHSRDSTDRREKWKLSIIRESFEGRGGVCLFCLFLCATVIHQDIEDNCTDIEDQNPKALMFWQRWPERRETDGLPSEARDGGRGGRVRSGIKKGLEGTEREREKGGRGGGMEGGGAAVLRWDRPHQVGRY
jgi:hypothetical protein